METKEKPKFRFNFIDLILLLIILAAVSILGYIFMTRNASATGTSTRIIEYQVEVKNMREELAYKVNIDDRITDSVKLYPIGEVVDVKYTDAIYIGVNTNPNDTRLVSDLYPEHKNMYVTVRAKADFVKGMYMIGGYRVSVGSPVSFRVPNFTGTGYCTSLSEVKQ